jgi:DNA-binding transcriptional MerR regulator
MDLADAIAEMLKAGYSEEQIIDYLRQQGFSPKEVLDALNKLKLRKEEVMPSIMEVPQPSPPSQPSPPLEAKTEKLIPQMPFAEEATIAQMPSYGLETIETLAEEIINEKFELMKRRIGDIEELKKNLEDKIKSLEEKVKRIEYNLDNINLLILKRHEEQHREIKQIGKEISMLEEAFGKVLKPLTENIKKLEELSKDLKKGKG